MYKNFINESFYFLFCTYSSKYNINSSYNCENYNESNKICNINNMHCIINNCSKNFCNRLQKEGFIIDSINDFFSQYEIIEEFHNKIKITIYKSKVEDKLILNISYSTIFGQKKFPFKDYVCSLNYLDQLIYNHILPTGEKILDYRGNIILTGYGYGGFFAKLFFISYKNSSIFESAYVYSSDIDIQTHYNVQAEHFYTHNSVGMKYIVNNDDTYTIDKPYNLNPIVYDNTIKYMSEICDSLYEFNIKYTDNITDLQYLAQTNNSINIMLEKLNNYDYDIIDYMLLFSFFRFMYMHNTDMFYGSNKDIFIKLYNKFIKLADSIKRIKNNAIFTSFGLYNKITYNNIILHMYHYIDEMFNIFINKKSFVNHFKYGNQYNTINLTVKLLSQNISYKLIDKNILDKKSETYNLVILYALYFCMPFYIEVQDNNKNIVNENLVREFPEQLIKLFLNRTNWTDNYLKILKDIYLELYSINKVDSENIFYYDWSRYKPDYQYYRVCSLNNKCYVLVDTPLVQTIFYYDIINKLNKLSICDNALYNDTSLFFLGVHIDGGKYDHHKNITWDIYTNNNVIFFKQYGTISKLEIFLNLKESTEKLVLECFDIDKCDFGIKLEKKNIKASDSDIEYNNTIYKVENNNSKSAEKTKDYPIVSSDTICCPHGGMVKFKKSKYDNFLSNNDGLIFQQDLLEAEIVNCSNYYNPCKKISFIPKASLSINTYNGKHVIAQSLVSYILTDVGFPLFCVPKPNQYCCDILTSRIIDVVDKDIKINIKSMMPTIILNYDIYGIDKYYINNAPFKANNEYQVFDINNVISIKVSTIKDEQSIDEKYRPILIQLNEFYNKNLSSKNQYIFKVFSIKIRFLEYYYVIKVPRTNKKYSYMFDKDTYNIRINDSICKLKVIECDGNFDTIKIYINKYVYFHNQNNVCVIFNNISFMSEYYKQINYNGFSSSKDMQIATNNKAYTYVELKEAINKNIYNEFLYEFFKVLNGDKENSLKNISNLDGYIEKFIKYFGETNKIYNYVSEYLGCTYSMQVSNKIENILKNYNIELEKIKKECETMEYDTLIHILLGDIISYILPFFFSFSVISTKIINKAILMNLFKVFFNSSRVNLTSHIIIFIFMVFYDIVTYYSSEESKLSDDEKNNIYRVFSFFFYLYNNLNEDMMQLFSLTPANNSYFMIIKEFDKYFLSTASIYCDSVYNIENLIFNLSFILPDTTMEHYVTRHENIYKNEFDILSADTKKRCQLSFFEYNNVDIEYKQEYKINTLIESSFFEHLKNFMERSFTFLFIKNKKFTSTFLLDWITNSSMDIKNFEESHLNRKVLILTDNLNRDVSETNIEKLMKKYINDFGMSDNMLFLSLVNVLSKEQLQQNISNKFKDIMNKIYDIELINDFYNADEELYFFTYIYIFLLGPCYYIPLKSICKIYFIGKEEREIRIYTDWYTFRQRIYDILFSNNYLNNIDIYELYSKKNLFSEVNFENNEFNLKDIYNKYKLYISNIKSCHENVINILASTDVNASNLLGKKILDSSKINDIKKLDEKIAIESLLNYFNCDIMSCKNRNNNNEHNEKFCSNESCRLYELKFWLNKYFSHIADILSITNYSLDMNILDPSKQEQLLSAKSKHKEYIMQYININYKNAIEYFIDPADVQSIVYSTETPLVYRANLNADYSSPEAIAKELYGTEYVGKLSEKIQYNKSMINNYKHILDLLLDNYYIQNNSSDIKKFIEETKIFADQYFIDSYYELSSKMDLEELNLYLFYLKEVIYDTLPYILPLDSTLLLSLSITDSEYKDILYIMFYYLSSIYYFDDMKYFSIYLFFCMYDDIELTHLYASIVNKYQPVVTKLKSECKTNENINQYINQYFIDNSVFRFIGTNLHSVFAADKNIITYIEECKCYNNIKNQNLKSKNMSYYNENSFELINSKNILLFIASSIPDFCDVVIKNRGLTLSEKMKNYSTYYKRLPISAVKNVASLFLTFNYIEYLFPDTISLYNLKEQCILYEKLFSKKYNNNPYYYNEEGVDYIVLPQLIQQNYIIADCKAMLLNIPEISSGFCFTNPVNGLLLEDIEKTNKIFILDMKNYLGIEHHKSINDMFPIIVESYAFLEELFAYNQSLFYILSNIYDNYHNFSVYLPTGTQDEEGMEKYQESFTDIITKFFVCLKQITKHNHDIIKSYTNKGNSNKFDVEKKFLLSEVVGHFVYNESYIQSDVDKILEKNYKKVYN